MRQNTSSFVDDFREDASALAEDHGLSVVVEENQPGEAVFDPGMIRRVLLNALSNALHYTPKSGRIALSSRVEENTWRVPMDNDGANVPEEKLELIFERFVRFENGAETRDASTGSGLGLAIARSIVEAHGGTIHAANRASGGLGFTMKLPNAPPRAT